MNRTSDLVFDTRIAAFRDDKNELYVPVSFLDGPNNYAVDAKAGLFLSPGGVTLHRIKRLG